MKLFNLVVFDDNISGTSTTWYTPAEFNDPLGLADQLMFQAYATNVSGTATTLTVQAEHSADGQNWVNIASSAEITSTISSTPVSVGYTPGFVEIKLSLTRLRISLSNDSSAQCRLKVTATGRTF